MRSDILISGPHQHLIIYYNNDGELSKHAYMVIDFHGRISINRSDKRIEAKDKGIFLELLGLEGRELYSITMKLPLNLCIR